MRAQSRTYSKLHISNALTITDQLTILFSNKYKSESALSGGHTGLGVRGFVLSVLLLPAPACLSPSYQSRPPPAGSYQTLLQPFSNRLPLRILSLSGTISLSFVCCPTTVQHNTAVKRLSSLWLFIDSLGIGLVFFAHYQSVRERCGSAQCLRAGSVCTYTYIHDTG